MESSTCAKNENGTGPTGWPGMEEHLLVYDEKKMRGYTEGIDTLLVFAGLFSAILSAFVVQTYQMLHPSDTTITNQLLAYGISSQSNGNPLPAFIDITVSNALSAALFTPSIAVRWINALFFVSLVLSLLSAFVGIRAKQWVREFLRWHAPLAAARENVLVRQLQCEAWEAWHATAAIAAVPMLLELAMLLFLAGLAVLLWTLDDVVAVVVTAVVALAFVVIAALTVLPVLVRRCPYRSPTAWACLKMCSLVALFGSGAVRSGRAAAELLCRWWRQRKQLRSTNSNTTPTFQENAFPKPASHRSWRERDLESCRRPSTSALSWRKPDQSLWSAARAALSEERGHLDECGRPISQNAIPVRPSDEAVSGLVVDIAECSCLVRALSWAHRASQDPRVRAIVSQCIDDLHPLPPPDAPGVRHVRATTDWYLLGAAARTLLHDPLAVLRDSGDALVRGLRGCTGVSVACGVQGQLELRQGPSQVAVASSLRRLDTFPALVRLVAADIRSLACMSTQSQSFTQQRRVLELFAVLQALTIEGTLRESGWYLDVLQAIMPIESRWPSGFLSGIFVLACGYGKLSADSDGNLCLREGFTTKQDYESLLVRYFSTTVVDSGPDRITAFLLSAVRWLRTAELATSPLITVAHVISALTDIVHAAASGDIALPTEPEELQGARLAYGLWYQRHQLAEAVPAAFCKLLHALEQCHLCGALAGDHQRITFLLHKCLERAHEGLVCDYHDSENQCPWTLHACTTDEPPEPNCSSLANELGLPGRSNVLSV